MPIRRRRPMLRAAAVGGGAYYMGKRRAESQAQAEPAESGQSSPSATPSAAPDQGGMSTEAMQRLQELAELHKQGVLTDEEFDAQKARILS